MQRVYFPAGTNGEFRLKMDMSESFPSAHVGMGGDGYLKAGAPSPREYDYSGRLRAKSGGAPRLGGVSDTTKELRLVVGSEYTATTSYYFLLLTVAPSVSCSRVDALNTPHCLPLSATRLSLLPNHHPSA